MTARPGPGRAADREAVIAAQHAGSDSRVTGAPGNPRIQPAVVLIGPPGSGKSTVGAAISRSTGWPLRDVDDNVEKQAGKTISDIFLDDGEAHFRELEKAAVAAALATHAGVLSLGGGAILAAQTRRALAGQMVVFLNLSMPTGVRRTGMAANRPLLAGINPRATYKALLEARTPLYREVARYEIQTDDLSAAEVARIVVQQLGDSQHDKGEPQ